MYPSQNHTVLGLREPTLEDLRWMAEMACDELLVGEHNWGGENRDVDEVEAELRTAFDIDGLVAVESGTLLVQLDAGDRIGDVSWRTEQWGPSTRSRCPAIGVALLPDFRGRGLGTIAQQLLVDRLFERDQRPPSRAVRHCGRQRRRATGSPQGRHGRRGHRARRRVPWRSLPRPHPVRHPAIRMEGAP
jgi:RimJ/RimL family protein N-acetyltransferase